MGWGDWSVIAIYGLVVIAIGWYVGRRNESAQEYFIGSGHTSPMLIGVSLFVTLLSTISYLSMPGEIIGKGPVYMTRIFAYPLAYVFIGYVLLPIYMRQRVTSAYELLETKLGGSVRMLGAALFIILRIIWMSLLVYLSAKTMTVMLGIGDAWIPALVVTTGLATVLYTSLGGFRAVIITDFLQALFLLVGVLCVLGVITYRVGGLQWLPTGWEPHWDQQPLYSFDPSTRVTVFGTILSTWMFLVCTSGGDQTAIQRFMSTKDASSARRASAYQAIAATIVSLMLGLAGFAMLSYCRIFHARIPIDLLSPEGADNVFPWFIAHELPMGIAGLVVAAMFAAAMSSLDSGVNSIAAVTITDFFDRFDCKPSTERGHLRLAQGIALVVGVLVVLGSSQVGSVPGNITVVTSKTANLLAPTLFCLFFFALFVPFANAYGVWAGAICGTLAAILSAFAGPIFGASSTNGGDPISFQWIAPLSLSTNIAVGMLVSFVTSGPKRSESAALSSDVSTTAASQR
ncbi:sodium-coupled permease [Blastopirellula marina DSM 3645]|uniref:Sodium-coupled permease n=1 Tax=Blastopirellula marina DSM 3645 TaxID=314230 RepID=A3ZY88_9BACT|nr:sodium-coupled permease [Blastopirellula marina DSM 3645]